VASFLFDDRMAQNSNLNRELYEVGIAVFIIAILFGLSVGVGLFFHYYNVCALLVVFPLGRLKN
jgi:hypothetical protein